MMSGVAQTPLLVNELPSQAQIALALIVVKSKPINASVEG